MPARTAAATLMGWFRAITNHATSPHAPSRYMATKAIYTVVAVVGIAAASGLAWWYQNKPATARTDSAQAPAAAPRAGASGGPSRPPAVEVARVDVIKLTDDAQAVGSLRSRQS